MSTGTSIAWTDATWNPVTGCTRVSAGCENCYSVRMTHRLEKMGQQKYTGLTVLNPDGDRHFNGIVKCHEDELTTPLRWKSPRRVFVNSMSDTFHKDVPFAFIDKMFAMMALCPQHTFQVLTKRPERMAEYLYPQRFGNVALTAIKEHVIVGGPAFERMKGWGRGAGWPLPNVWLGTSCEDQAAANERIPHLLRCPAAVRFISAEPLLGPIDLHAFTYFVTKAPNTPHETGGIDWTIVGGESGPGARPCRIEWIRGIIAQCKAAGVACFTKQLGARVEMSFDTWNSDFMPLTDKHDFCVPKADGTVGIWRGYDPKGGDPDEWPADLRVREFPKT